MHEPAAAPEGHTRSEAERGLSQLATVTPARVLRNAPRRCVPADALRSGTLRAPKHGRRYGPALVKLTGGRGSGGLGGSPKPGGSGGSLVTSVRQVRRSSADISFHRSAFLRN